MLINVYKYYLLFVYNNMLRLFIYQYMCEKHLYKNTFKIISTIYYICINSI